MIFNGLMSQDKSTDYFSTEVISPFGGGQGEEFDTYEKIAALSSPEPLPKGRAVKFCFTRGEVLKFSPEILNLKGLFPPLAGVRRWKMPNLVKSHPSIPTSGEEKSCKSLNSVQILNAKKFARTALNSPAPKGAKFSATLENSTKIESLSIKSKRGVVKKSNTSSYILKKSTIKLTLNQIIEMAKSQSIAARQASTQKETAYWQYRSYLSNYKPQLTLNGTLPNFNRTFQEVLQPDGTIEFQPVTNNNSDLTFSLNQRIAATGATIFVNSQLQRFDDFDRDFTLYNGLPIGIGIEQPLFAFNPLKWEKKTEPLRYEESKQNYIESLENIGLSATNRFFEFLISQVNLQIAESNVSNNDTIYKIALERFDLGKISKNDLLQLRLGVLQAKKSEASAKQSLEIADLQLKSFVGYREEGQIELMLPTEMPNLQIDTDRALQEAFVNRGDAIGFKRRALEAERAVAQAKGENGFQANIFAAVGLSNSAKNVSDLYKNPQDRETIQIGFEIPILDWGRAKSRMETAKANKQLVEYEVEQDRIVLEEEIYTLITLFNMLKDQLALSKEADEIADERYEIAKNRFFIGNLSITDLTIALQEKDQAKRDYIFSLKDFWTTWLTIRVKTLYDFELGRKIIYAAN